LLQEFTDYAIDSSEIEAAQARAAAEDSDSPIVKLLNLIIWEAFCLRASEIHMEPFADRVRFRFRIDGVLFERDSPPRRLLDPMLSRIKLMSNITQPERQRPQVSRLNRLLDPLLSRIQTISERQRLQDDRIRTERPRPQEGRIKMNVKGWHFDLRVSILPTHHGEAAVMRICYRNRLGIDDLGFDQEDRQRFRQLIDRSNGMFLVTGPVGSGKTTTLYSALNEMNRPDRKIIAAEDPVEYSFPGINQVEVKRTIGLDFARIIRALSRQGPNIILVGAIRDLETAEIAMQASLAGSLVLSTLHSTNDAPSAISRLGDMGVQPFLIAGSVIAIMAQRLVRAVCQKCKEPEEPDQAQLKSAQMTPDQLAQATFVRGRGCNSCYHTGYRGRLGIFELMTMSAPIRELAFNRAPIKEIRQQARLLGMRTLLEDGVAKATKGFTTLDQVLSACHHEIGTQVTH
jgi:type IV pilus assembly protein PilB